MDTEEPAPPPNPELLNRQPKWFKPVLYVCLGASSLVAIALLMAPMVIRGGHRNRDLTEATNNARQVGFSLLEFDSDYGSYPNETTAALVTESHPAHGYDLSGTSSNALFRQFFAAGLTQSEAMFHAKTKDFTIGSDGSIIIPDGSTIKPDNIITDGEALKKGEVGFSYITGLSSENLRSTSFLLTPILLTPLIPGTTKFDPKPFKGFAVVLHTDNSVRSYKIAKDGHVYDDNGFDILSPENPIWGGIAPDIRYPDL